MTPRSFQLLADLLRERAGIALGTDKLYLVQTRLAGLLRGAGLAGLDALADRVALAPRGELADAVVEAMTTNETLFFRDEQAFAHLRDVALPRLAAARLATGQLATGQLAAGQLTTGQRLRIWSAAASSGQEAYSVAMLLAEARPPWPAQSVEILATDIARLPLARGREALYSAFEVQRGLSPARLAQHFERAEEGWRVRAGLRAMVRFQRWNLLADPAPLGRFDIILCRNVLIYFDPPTRARVLAGLARVIAPDGCLYLGGTETLLGLGEGFAAEPGGRGVFAPEAAARLQLASAPS